MNKYKQGTFYAKIYNSTGTNHIAYNGSIDELLVPIDKLDTSTVNQLDTSTVNQLDTPTVNLLDTPTVNLLTHTNNPLTHTNILPKRKHIILSNNDETINIDVAFLDKYKLLSKHFTNPITNLGHIMRIIGINCTHVNIIKHMPFSKKVIEINDLDLDNIYE